MVSGREHVCFTTDVALGVHNIIYKNTMNYTYNMVMYKQELTRDSDPGDQEMFIVEGKAIKHLRESLVKPCSCHFSGGPWKLDKLVQVFPTNSIYIYPYDCPWNTTERTCSPS